MGPLDVNDQQAVKDREAPRRGNRVTTVNTAKSEDMKQNYKKPWWTWLSWAADWNILCVIKMLTGDMAFQVKIYRYNTSSAITCPYTEASVMTGQSLATLTQRCFIGWLTGFFKCRILKWRAHSFVYNKHINRQMALVSHYNFYVLLEWYMSWWIYQFINYKSNTGSQTKMIQAEDYRMKTGDSPLPRSCTSQM